jgi:hypothetical protein
VGTRWIGPGSIRAPGTAGHWAYQLALGPSTPQCYPTVPRFLFSAPALGVEKLVTESLSLRERLGLAKSFAGGACSEACAARPKRLPPTSRFPVSDYYVAIYSNQREISLMVMIVANGTSIYSSFVPPLCGYKMEALHHLYSTGGTMKRDTVHM